MTDKPDPLWRGLLILSTAAAQGTSDSDPRDPAGRGGYRTRPEERR